MTEEVEKPAGSSAPLWNPNAAANWSLLFTPVFGAYVHSKNWQALGEQQHAKASMNWVYMGLALLVFYVLLGVFVPNEKAADGIARLLGFIFLLSWYFTSAKAQAKYVKTAFGNSYARKPWGKTLLLGVAGIFGYMAFALIVGFLLGIVLGLSGRL